MMKKGEVIVASGHTAVVTTCRQINMQFVWGGYIKCPKSGALYMQQWYHNGVNTQNPNYDIKL